MNEMISITGYRKRESASTIFTSRVTIVFWYVDDILVFIKRQSTIDWIEKLGQVFNSRDVEEPIQFIGHRNWLNR